MRFLDLYRVIGRYRVISPPFGGAIHKGGVWTSGSFGLEEATSANKTGVWSLLWWDGYSVIARVDQGLEPLFWDSTLQLWTDGILFNYC